MELDYIDSRFYSADPARCYCKLHFPMQIQHPKHTASMPEGKRFDEILLPLDSVDQNFKAWLNSMGLFIELVRLFKNTPNYQYSYHVDRMTEGDQTVALNFAFDDQGTIFSWSNLKKGAIPGKRLNLNKVPVYYFDPDHCVDILKEEIQHEYNQPFLVNTGYIHSVSVSSTHRYCYSYFLRKISDKKQLEWDDAIVYFKDYII